MDMRWRRPGFIEILVLIPGSGVLFPIVLGRIRRSAV